MSEQIRDELMREQRNLKQTEEGMNTLRRENGRSEVLDSDGTLHTCLQWIGLFLFCDKSIF